MASQAYEAAFAYLSQPSYTGGMESSSDFLRLFVAMLRNEEGLAGETHMPELAYHLSDAQRRLLQQLAAAANRRDDAAIVAEISEAQYDDQRARRFGASNPEQMNVPFWIFMVRRGWTAYQARMQFDHAYRRAMDAYRTQRMHKEAGEAVDDASALPHPAHDSAIWCFRRFGMTLTRLPDGRALFIAGEHEDFYDPDFCIYNDVIVIDPDLRVTVYGYPPEIFPPTDFHSATLIGEDSLYLIGSLGYMGERSTGTTPVYRLDTTTMQIAVIQTSGTNPGWISRHSAEYDADRNLIKVTGGQIFTSKRGNQCLRDNRSSYWLNLTTMEWSRRMPSITEVRNADTS